ncbi:hypothetical protein BSKO_08242 [Bryopsis sp. KO-2023]|nr:hypothetical protein BSKO_08242 [Bryopsis sp. KO-2023]
MYGQDGPKNGKNSAIIDSFWISKTAEERQARGYAADGDWLAAVKCYRIALRRYRFQISLRNAVIADLSSMPSECLAQQWSEDIVEAEKPAIFSSRDGKWLKPVPNGLTRKTVSNLLLLAFAHDSDLKSAGAAMLTTRGTKEFRCCVALLRGVAYLQGGRLEQALKDARTSIACKVDGWGFLNRSFLLLSRVLEENGKYTEAAIAAAKGVELNENKVGHEALERILNRLDDTQRRIFEGCGYHGLERWLEDNKEMDLPEILRKRPKYFYYYEWMRERIDGHCGALPEPVMDKLLTMEAGDLDTLLKSSEATKAQALELAWVLENKGDCFLQTYKTDDLTWEEVKYITQGEQGKQYLDCEKQTDSEPEALRQPSAQHPEEQETKELSIVSQVAASRDCVTRKEKMLELIGNARRGETT